MASASRKTLVYGNHRVTFLVLVDQGEGDLEELPEGASEAPILIEKIETRANVAMGGDPIWHEVEEMYDLGEQYSAIARLEQQNQRLRDENNQLNRQLGILEHGQKVALASA